MRRSRRRAQHEGKASACGLLRYLLGNRRDRSYSETLYSSSHRDAIDLDNRVLRVRQSLEVIGTGKDRTVRFKAPKTEKSRHDVALTSGAIQALRSQHARQSKLQLHLSGPFCDERLLFPNPRTGEPWKADTFERVSAGRQSLWVTEGELPRASSLVRIDLATRRHAP